MSVRSFKGVCFKKFQECVKEVLILLTENFKGVSRRFKGCFEEVSRVFQARKFQGNLKGFSRKIQGC